MDEPRHVGAPAPAEPKNLREAETGTLSPGEGAPSATAPSPREEAADPAGVIEEPGAAEAAEAAATEPDVRMPEPAEAVAEAEPGRGQTPRRHDPEMHAASGARGLTPFDDLGADIPPAQAEPAATQAAPRAPEPEALPWGRASDASVAPIVWPPAPPARPVPAWLPAWQPSLPSRETVVAYLRFAGRVAAAAVVGFVGLVLMLVVLYRWVDPPVSTLMLGQRLAGTPIERTWVPLERISPHLIKAAVLSEDGAFCRHRGVDWTALEEARESARGGSTITMQVVKNLFLWPSRSYVRKAIEIALACLVELVWPKRRILEIYLNIAEWGDGVFGAEAAARWHFGKSAAQLTAAEAALLAVALPNPTERMAGSPSPGMSRLAKRLLARMTASRASLSCVRTAPRPSRQAHLFRGGD